ncbi:Serine/threonine-protein kinase pkn5 [Aquisphaera giovannonii]|uniref:non-specific serine/threonine protein kinase n=1 Tax=Aquisphaera giovannonii TaxID=406548 RepID=A0A5B9VVY9_9BACT|nr:protein kinase [Aquisphaera giovannonii]QEH31955.1 Serine/threonine-protein kinase pkn5 [Aquisphaera giovannonii]
MATPEPTDDGRNPVEALAEEFLGRRRRGEEATPEDYARDYPELADEILAVFPALLMMEDLGASSGGRTGPITSAGGVAPGATSGRLGEFRLIREVGRGGMGVVYEAEQESLGRRVALKVLPAGALADSKQVRRFEREARSAARLHHTHIVPVFGVGRHDGTHFYVMQFIQGQGLDAVLGELKRLRAPGRGEGPGRPATRPTAEVDGRRRAAADIAQSLVTGRFDRAAGAGAGSAAGAPAATAAWSSIPGASPPAATAPPGPSASGISTLSGGASAVSETDRNYARGVARVGLQVAEALAYAHGQGILHRDIKPGNLLLDRDGNVWVADFGLAKAVGVDDLTHTGDIVGTVRYMAPERFRGEGDARADVYALGLTLYELLALRPAFDESDRASLMRQVTQEDPPRLRRLNRAVPPDLETIIHKAMSRDPGARYRGAAEMADDLQRFLDGRPIRARRVSPSERLYRWARRNPALAASLGLAAVLLVGTTIGAVVGMARFRTIAREARDAASAADSARAEAVAAGRLAESRRIEAEAQRRRAEASLAESQASLVLARKAVDDSFTKVSESTLLDVPGLRPLRRQLLESSLPFYEEFLRRHGGNDPTGLAELAATQYRVARVLSETGRGEQAEERFRRAIALYDQALAARPGDASLREAQAEAWHRYADHFFLGGRMERSGEPYAKAVALREQLSAQHPGEPRYRLGLSRSLNGVGISTRDRDTRYSAFRRSLELRLDLAREIPDDPDLLHGLCESFLNMGNFLADLGRREQALELARRAIDYGMAACALRPHDVEFAADLSGAFAAAESSSGVLGRAGDALRHATERVAFARRLVAENPEVPTYRTHLHDALNAQAHRLAQQNRPDGAREAREAAAAVHETAPSPAGINLARAAAARLHAAKLLAGDRAEGPPEAPWPEAARRQLDAAVEDLARAAALGYPVAGFGKTFPEVAPQARRIDLDAVAERAAALRKTAGAGAPTPSTPAGYESPLHQPGRFELDRLIAEVAADSYARPGAEAENLDRLRSLLARLDARRAAAADSPGLDAAAASLRMRQGSLLWASADYAGAERAWRAVFDPIERLPRDDPRRAAALRALSSDALAVYSKYLDVGLWEIAARYHRLGREGRAALDPVLAQEGATLEMLAGDAAAARRIAADALDRFERDGGWDAIHDLNASMVDPRPPDPGRLLAYAQRLRGTQPDNEWSRIIPGLALIRAGHFDQVPEAVGRETSWEKGKVVVALAAARAGQVDRARRWLRAVDVRLEELCREGASAQGTIGRPVAYALDVLRADLLRREAYGVLKVPAPEIAPLRLLRGTSLWRLGRREEAEAEFATAASDAAADGRALADRARAFESLGLRDRAEADLEAAARLDPGDPHPWIARARLMEARGDRAEADAAYARAAERTGGRIDPFLEAGWWAAGPFPDDMDRSEPPEKEADPSRPASTSGGEARAWRPLPTAGDHGTYFTAFQGQASSVYALTYLYADRERTALLCCNGSARLRIWVNGRLVYSPEAPPAYRPGPERLVPIALGKGRNTLLLRVAEPAALAFVIIKGGDCPLNQGYLLAECGRWGEAADAIAGAVARGESRHPWPLAKAAHLLLAEGRREERAALLARLVDFEGMAPVEATEVGEALAAGPQDVVSTERVVELARRGVSEHPLETWRLLPLGIALYRDGRHREAIEAFDRHTPQGDPLDAAVRAMAHWKLGEAGRARECLARADREFEAWCADRADGKGSAAWTSWWYDGPLRYALRREAHDLIDGRAPDDRAALDGVRAAMAGLLEDRDSPTWAFELAYRLDPESGAYRQGYASRLLVAGRSAGAEPFLAAMVHGKEGDPDAWTLRGELLARAGRTDQAAEDFERAVALVPPDLAVYSSRSKALANLNRFPQVLDRLIERRPGDAGLWYARACHRLIRGDAPGAVGDFARGGPPPASTEFALAYAGALLMAGDEPGYRRYVAEQAGRFGGSSDAFAWFVLARMASLSARTPLPPERPLDWARRFFEKDPTPWSAHVLALAAFRAGDLVETRRALAESRQRGWDAQHLNDLIEAAIDLRGGSSVAAARTFASVRPWMAGPPGYGPVVGRGSITDWVELRVLGPQVELPLLDRSFPTHPFAR